MFPPKKINFQTAGFAFLGAGLATDHGEVEQEGQAGIHCEDLEMGNLPLFKLRHGSDTVDGSEICRSPPGMYKTCIFFLEFVPYQLVQDF